MPDLVHPPFPSQFAALRDPRQAAKVLHQAKAAISLKNPGKRAGWNWGYLAQVIQQAM